MKLILTKIIQLLVVFSAMLTFQTSVFAQSIVIPGFLAVENSYLEAPDAGEDSTLAYFTISNLHNEPIVLLNGSSEIFENAVLNGPGHQEIDSIVIQPRERLEMQADGYHMHLASVDAEVSAGSNYEITLQVRRGLEAEEEVEASRANATSGMRGREAGIPNEHDIVVRVPVRN